MSILCILSLMRCHSFHQTGMKRGAMAPLDDSFQNDAAFQSLLSSQRELLNRLKSEQETKTQQRKPNSSKKRRTSGTPFRDDWLNGPNNLSIGLGNFRHENVLHPHRMSLGIGNDNYILRDFEPRKFNSEGSYSDAFLLEDDEDIKTEKLDVDDGTSVHQRRRSTLGFLHYLFEKHDGRRASMDTVRQMESSEDQKAADGQRSEAEEESDDDDDYGVYMVDADDGENDTEENNTEEADVQVVTEAEQVRRHLVVFESTMEKTQNSQQAIHDWDRKMGLKRSHSKTMRLSCRSRKKIRAFIKKEITHLRGNF